MESRKRLIYLIRYCTSCEECRDEDIADHILSSSFITELQNEAYDMGVDSALHNHFGLPWKDAAELRKEIKSLQETPRWIPVTERLPENKKSPCESCTISTNPAACQKKQCRAWQEWWLGRWKLIFAYGQKHT